MQARCQCGSIKFPIPHAAPDTVYICHCNECRAQSSSAFGVSALFPLFDLPFSTEPSSYKNAATATTITSSTAPRSQYAYGSDQIGLYSRRTLTGGVLNCFFCKTCGSRMVHCKQGKDSLIVKGGVINGLDWGGGGKGIKHIWCKEAVIPIPEGVERWDAEPDD